MDGESSLLLQQIITQQSAIASDVSALRAEITKAVTHLEVVEARNRTADQLSRDHETRIRMLERFRYTLAGMAVIGGILAGFIGDLIGHVTH